MLTIRLTRKGKKNQPFFRVVVIDKRRSSKGGRAVEDLGYKNPLTKKISLNKERILYWISKGAQPSASIHNLLVAEKIVDAKKIHVSKISKKKQAEINKSKEETVAKEKASAESPADNQADKEPKPEDKGAERTLTPSDSEEQKEPAESSGEAKQ
jgi:small subunit ribosomal protein S16